MAFNKKPVPIMTPAGNKAGAPGNSACAEKIEAHLSFGVDAANPPPATSLRGDPFSVTRVSQGLYRVQLGGATLTAGKYGVKKVIDAQVQLQKTAVSVNGAELGDINDANGTIDIRTVNRSTGAVVDPAAVGASERIHLTITFDNGAP